VEEILIQTQGLCQFYSLQSRKLFAGERTVKAVNQVDLDIRRGESLGLAGESGCGKSTLGKTILRLIKPTHGTVSFAGRDVGKLSAAELKTFRTSAQIVFQDPYSSLNPRMTIGELLREPLLYHKLKSRREAGEEADRLLRLVGLEPETEGRYPHEFSGGQRQRVAIARALSVSPRFIVCDEPVSALDVSIQAQILNLFDELKNELGLTYLFISHDLSALRYVCDRIAVMYLGRIVEIAPTGEICKSPAHPYTKALFSAVPSAVWGEKKTRTVLKGEPPSPVSPPSGCAFHERCPHALPGCALEVPELKAVAQEHFAACPRIGDL